MQLAWRWLTTNGKSCLLLINASTLCQTQPGVQEDVRLTRHRISLSDQLIDTNRCKARLLSCTRPNQLNVPMALSLVERHAHLSVHMSFSRCRYGVARSYARTKQSTGMSRSASGSRHSVVKEFLQHTFIVFLQLKNLSKAKAKHIRR